MKTMTFKDAVAKFSFSDDVDARIAIRIVERFVADVAENDGDYSTCRFVVTRATEPDEDDNGCRINVGDLTIDHTSAEGGDMLCATCWNVVDDQPRPAADADACPGCGCQPGDGVTVGCSHPDGCGAFADQKKEVR